MYAVGGRRGSRVWEKMRFRERFFSYSFFLFFSSLQRRGFKGDVICSKNELGDRRLKAVRSCDNNCGLTESGEVCVIAAADESVPGRNWNFHATLVAEFQAVLLSRSESYLALGGLSPLTRRAMGIGRQVAVPSRLRIPYAEGEQT